MSNKPENPNKDKKYRPQKPFMDLGDIEDKYLSQALKEAIAEKEAKAKKK